MRGLDDHQLAELAKFVNALFVLGGYQRSADWARDAGYPEPNLSRLRNGKGDASGYNLFKLIRAVALRLDDPPVDVALAAALHAEAAEAPSRAELARRLEELGTLVAEALARMGTGIEPGSQQPPDAEAPTAEGAE